MVIFDFDEYFIKGCVIPCICFIFGLAVVVASTLILIKNYNGISRYSFIKRCYLIYPPAMILIFGFVFLTIIGQTLKYGVFLLTENSSDALYQVGLVEKIQPISLPPRYSTDEPYGKAVEAKIDGSVYYFMSGNELSLNDTIEFQYLPKSRMVLSYQSISYSEYLDKADTEISTERISKIDPIFALVFTGVMVLFALFAKSQYWDRKLEQIVQADDEEWEKNEVRFHISYVKTAAIFSVTVIFASVLLSYLFSTFLILLLGIIVAIVGFALMFNEYKCWRLIYTDNKITVSHYMGIEETILFSDIIAINDTIENLVLTRGAVYRVVKIRYRSSVLRRTIEQTITLDYRHHVGISRFLKYYRTRSI